jgi:16S rRNA (guanine527-N7)-methyltransferase
MHEKNKEEADKKIEQFVYEALAFNKKHNIFVRESIEDVYEKDVYDCFPVLKKINNSDNILDLGSGGGFPGIIIAIVKPMCEIHLLEKSKKKCYFLNKTIDLLGLKNAKVLDTVINKNNNLGSYSLITARAFSSTANILKLTPNNLDDSGKYVLLKGKKEKISEELATIDTNKYKYEIIKLENKKYERHLLEIRKSE